MLGRHTGAYSSGNNLFSLTLKNYAPDSSDQRGEKRGDVVLTDTTPGLPPGDEIIREKLAQKRNRELFGNAELMMGANHILLRCFDGVARMGRIKRKIKKKVWICEGHILLVIPWNFQDEKCDIIYHFTGPQVEWLQRNKHL